jgi:predicted dienelactone hydrolase
MKSVVAVGFVAFVLVLSACGSSGTPIGATNPLSGNNNPGAGTPPAAKAANVALFQLSAGLLPYPTDLYFAGSTDGTLNIEPANALEPNQAAINALDGFSTTAPIRARFGGALAPASLNAASVIMVQVNIDNATKATVGVVRPLVLGTDFSVALASDAGVGNQIVEIQPLKPLVASSGATNNGYLVILTDGITDAAGNPAVPDTDYATIEAAQPTCAAISNATLNGVCRLTGAHLQIAQALGLNPAHIVLTFSFSTQSTRDTLAVVAATVAASPPPPIGVQNTGLTTHAINPFLPGKADVYVGTMQIPYYLSVSAPLTGFWQGNASPLDANSHFLTRFNPLPVKTTDVTIPVLVTVPNATSASGGVKPAAGWPVVIFQHGITRDRTDMFGVADSYADAGFVVVAIDMPLHGVTNTASPLYQGPNERTFNLDVINNTTGAAGPDGVIDPSGVQFINLTSVLTSRDNLREAAADLLSLTRALPTLSLGGNPAGDIDPTRIHYLGHSLGGIVGGVFAGVATTLKSATLAMAGGGIAALLRDSPTFGPRIANALASQGLTPGSTLLAQFFRDAQTAVDAGDPLNYIADAVAVHPVHVLQVVGTDAATADQVVPNSATARLILAGGLVKVITPGVTPVLPGSPPPGPPVPGSYVSFTAGSHGSIIDPTASLAVTTEMQREAVTFAASYNPVTNGALLVVSDPSVVQSP